MISYKYPHIIHAGLVFPRNETYEPGDLMPIIFGVDDNVIDYLNPHMQYTLSGDGTDYTGQAIRHNTTDIVEDLGHKTLLMPVWTDKFAKEGTYKITWTINVQQCDIDVPDPQNWDYGLNSTAHPNGTKPLEFKAATDEEALAVYFTVKSGGLGRNISSIRNDSCHAGPGVAFNVTNFPPIGLQIGLPGCLVYDREHPFVSSSSCHIGVNSSIEQDMGFVFLKYYLQAYCNLTNPPKSLACPKHNVAFRAISNSALVTMFVVVFSFLFFC